MPQIKVAPSFEIIHSIIINKYRTNDIDRNEINIVNHRNGLLRSLQLYKVNQKSKSDNNKIRQQSSTCPKESKTGTPVENLLHSRQYYLRSRFLSTENGMVSKSLPTSTDIKSDLYSKLENRKRDLSPKTFGRNGNISNAMDKKINLGQTNLVTTSDEEFSNEMCRGSQECYTPVSLSSSSKNVKATHESEGNKIVSIDVSQEQSQVNHNNVTSDNNSLLDFQRDKEKKVSAAAHIENSQLETIGVNLQNSQRIAERNVKNAGGNEIFSPYCRENNRQYLPSIKNGGQFPTVSSVNCGKRFVSPSKNVNKRQKLDFGDKSRFKPDATSATPISPVNNSVERIVKNDVPKRKYTNTVLVNNCDKNTSKQKQHKKPSNTGYYIKTSKRILKKKHKSYNTKMDFTETI